ncbi:MAG: SMC family ATPase [Chloroflexi bacterium]|nr:SMC family ATPase [Chloroflexota bacterium]
MLPTRLEIRNFLAYRAPDPIVFAGIELACLTGLNGVGKSSILDAITWALWGAARAKRDEELIHLGQNEMSVSIDFKQDGLRYRVSRRRARTGRGSRGALDLMVWGAGDAPRLINEDGLRRTQDKINQILRLDYDTFVHSAFLQQGRADAFTLKTAGERKRLLSDILGLDQWMVYEEAAKERLNALASQIDIISHDIRRLDEEIAGEPELRAEYDKLNGALNSAQAALDEANDRFSQVANSAAARRREQENALEKERAIESLRQDIEAAQAEIKRGDDRIAEYERTIAGGGEIEAGYQQLIAARESQSVIARLLAQREEVDQQIHRLEQALAEQRAGLTRQVEVTRERIKSLEETRKAGGASEIDALRADVSALERLDAKRSNAAKEAQQLQIQRSKTLTRLEALKTEGIALNERMERLKLADGATCPLCGQKLTEKHRDGMMAQLLAERDAMREQYREFTTLVQEYEKGGEELEGTLERWALQLKELPALQQQLGAAAELSRNADAAETALHLETLQLAQLEKRLGDKDYGHELQRQLAELEEQRQGLEISPDTHTKTQSQLVSLAAFDRQYTQLEFAKRNLPEAQRRHRETAARLSKLEAALAADQERLEQIQDEIALLAGKVEQERELRAEVERLRVDVQYCRERKTICEQQLNAIAAGRESKRRLAARLADAQKEQSLYNELRVAFGRNGVPAMIIETAVPELEAEANYLLARLTHGRMSLRIATQRERASGGLAETLEIEIADDLGPRPYELYSGGEAFRINFAIRIALSRLLARRSGAQLRTLFIDEGFGSQDEDGRDKLVDAINKIKSDFELILVITHIDELRDAFPVHLLVEKGAGGSHVTIS